jgi:hypothetical protein
MLLIFRGCLDLRQKVRTAQSVSLVAGAYILGVKPIEPGFKKFTSAPANNLVACAKGIVPAPCGNIHIN